MAALTGEYSADTLGGGGSTLVDVWNGETPASIASFTAAPSGALTYENGTRVDGFGPSDLAVSSNRSSVLIADGETEYATSTMAVTREFTSPDSSTPTAVALSSDGVHIAGGFDDSDLVDLFTQANSTPVWQRSAATSAPKTWVPGVESARVLPQCITFSSDGSTIYALAAVAGVSKLSLFASKLETSKTSLRMSVKSSTPRHPVSVATNSRGGRGHPEVHDTVNGAVSAEFLGTTSLYPSQAEKPFKIRSRSHVSLSGSYATHDGVKLFHSRKNVGILASVSPAVLGRSITVFLEYEHNGKWHVVGRLTRPLTKKGQAHIRLGPTPSDTLTRMKLSFHGDKLNPRSHALSPPFEIP